MSYSQLRIEDVQVAQIVCVVGWAEPGQHQQQQSLHRHCSALPAPLFRPSCSSLCTGVPSSSIHLTSPHLLLCLRLLRNLAALTPAPPPPLSSLAFLLQRRSRVLHFLSSAPPPPSSLYLCLSGSVAGCRLVISAAEASGPVARG